MRYALLAFFMGISMSAESQAFAGKAKQLKEQSQGYREIDPETEDIEHGENWTPQKKSFVKSKIDFLKRGGSCTEKCKKNVCYDKENYTWCAQNCQHKINLGAACAYSNITIVNKTKETLNALLLPTGVDEGLQMEGIAPGKSHPVELSLRENKNVKTFKVAVTPDDFDQSNAMKDSLTQCKGVMKVGVDYVVTLENYGAHQKPDAGFFGKAKNAVKGALKNNALNYEVKCTIHPSKNQKAHIKQTSHG
ncbi:MAG: hypothetical protein K2X98_02500 [Alphaproteobacteria bacterium]|nr:hypothetical protein [Alphaproteobacteria bacterium]